MLHPKTTGERAGGNGEVEKNSFQPDLTALYEIRGILTLLDAKQVETVVMFLARDIGCKLVKLEDGDVGY